MILNDYKFNHEPVQSARTNIASPSGQFQTIQRTLINEVVDDTPDYNRERVLKTANGGLRPRREVTIQTQLAASATGLAQPNKTLKLTQKLSPKSPDENFADK